MTQPSASPSLADLRVEIDRIDAGMHRLLMERGAIIDRLVQVKRTQGTEGGSAFRPAREADMMRRLVARHEGLLPLDTVESIWRVIISTFTWVQAPYTVHADLAVGDAGDARQRALPFRLHRAVRAPIWAPAARSPRSRPPRAISALVPAAVAGRWRVVDGAGGRERAPKIIARLPFVERADHPAGLPAVRGLPSHSPDAAVANEVRVSIPCTSSGWGAGGGHAALPALRRNPGGPRRARSTARRCWCRCRPAMRHRWRWSPPLEPRRRRGARRARGGQSAPVPSTQSAILT